MSRKEYTKQEIRADLLEVTRDLIRKSGDNNDLETSLIEELGKRGEDNGEGKYSRCLSQDVSGPLILTELAERVICDLYHEGEKFQGPKKNYFKIDLSYGEHSVNIFSLVPA